jgi:hypothetical protein
MGFVFLLIDGFPERKNTRRTSNEITTFFAMNFFQISL